MQPRFRLFNGEETSDSTTSPAPALPLQTSAAPLVSMTLEELTQILVDASRTNRTWLADFAGDEIQVPGDLYEVMTAYSRLRPSA